MAQASRPAASTSTAASLTPAPSPPQKPPPRRHTGAGSLKQQPKSSSAAPPPPSPASLVPLNNSVDEKLGRVPNVDSDAAADESALPHDEQEDEDKCVIVIRLERAEKRSANAIRQ